MANISGRQYHTDKLPRAPDRTGESSVSRACQIAWIPVLHLAGCCALAICIIRYLDGYKAVPSDSPNIIWGGYFKLHVSDVTTLISVALIAVKLLVGAWSGILVWNCVFMLLEGNGATLSQICRVTAFYIPPAPTRNTGLVVALALLLVIPQQVISPILTGAVGWNPGFEYNPSLARVQAGNPDSEPAAWNWYYYATRWRRAFVRRAASFSSITWEDSIRADRSHCRHIMNQGDAISLNSTLLGATIPYYNTIACYTYAIVSLTAGIATSDKSTYISSRIVEADAPSSDVEIRAGPWVQEAMYLMADVMSIVTMMNTTSLNTWGNLDQYLDRVIRYSYQSTWDMLYRSFDTNSSELPVKIYETRLVASVARGRVLLWLLISALLPLSSLLLIFGRRDIKRPMVLDGVVAALLTDPSPILTGVEDKKDLTELSYVTKEDGRLGAQVLRKKDQGGYELRRKSEEKRLRGEFFETVQRGAQEEWTSPEAGLLLRHGGKTGQDQCHIM